MSLLIKQEEFKILFLWRGFRSNYNMFLDNLPKNGDTLQTPIILATSLSENVSYRFVGFNRIVPTMEN